MTNKEIIKLMLFGELGDFSYNIACIIINKASMYLRCKMKHGRAKANLEGL